MSASAVHPALAAARRARTRWLGGAAVLAAFALSGCEKDALDGGAAASQPIAFPHKTHLDYFNGGKHREEWTKRHLEKLRETEPPEELVKGECASCHQDMVAETKDCAGCHVPFQDAALRARKDVRACVGCHRQAWSGTRATIPAAGVCKACHGGAAPITKSAEEARLREYLSKGEDVPWLKVTTLVNHVHFSHKAHVKYASFGCTVCHQDMSQRTTPLTETQSFSMSVCVRCHEKNHASTDCLACHK